MIALDTNLLVYAHRALAPEHKRASEALWRAGADRRGWGISAPVIAEFWRCVTDTRDNPSPPAAAASFLYSLFDSGLRCWAPRAGFCARLLDTVMSGRLPRGAIFDLQIALIAHENGATEIWTNDDNFVALPGLRVVNPL